MAAPVLQDSTYQDVASSSTPSFTLPATINADDGITASLTLNSGRQVASGGWPSGWIELDQGTFSSFIGGAWAYYHADGTEDGGTFQPTLNAAGSSACIFSRFSGVNFDNYPPEAGAVNSASSSGPTFGSVSHSEGGTKDYGYLESIAGDSVFQSVSGWSSGYTEQVNDLGNGVFYGTAYRQVTGDDGSEAPGAASLSGVEQWASLLIAIVEDQGSSGVSGSGALAAGSSTADGAGSREADGSGTLDSGSSSVAGSGSREAIGSGAVTASDSTASGSGTSSSAIDGSGSLLSGASTVNGAGSREVIGSAAFVAGDSQASGSGSTSAPTDGTGSLLSGDSTASGAGLRNILSQGVLQSGDSSLDGVSIKGVVGDGGLVSGDARASGSGGLPGNVAGTLDGNKIFDATRPIVFKDGTMTEVYRSLVLDLTKYLPIVGSGSPEGAIAALQYSVYIDQDSGTVWRKMQPYVGSNRSKGWIQEALATFSVQSYLAVTAEHDVASSDYFIDCTSGSFAVNLPTAVGAEGRRLCIKNSGTGVITVTPDGSETIDGGATAELYQWDSITLISDGANWKIE